MVFIDAIIAIIYLKLKNTSLLHIIKTIIARKTLIAKTRTT